MAKTKKGKKDPEKKAALQAKKEAKAEKAARKRLVKEARGAGGMEITDQDGHSGTTDPVSSKTRSAVRALAEIYQQQELPPTETVMIQSLGVGIFPPARANTTLTITTGKKVKQSDLYLFGGEYYDGVENIVLNQLYKYDWMEWRRIHCPAPIPPPRCAHTTVFYNGCLYVTGGELATAEEYHHYRDVWKFNTVTNAWTEILSTPTATKRKPGPSPRSGHAAAVWKHFMIVLGGFYEAARDAPRWFNDVHVMDLRTEQWLDIAPTPSRLSIQPEPRSATNCVVWNDVLVVHGGFSKVLDKARATPSTIASQTVPAETVVYSDTWLLHLKPILTGNPPTWERYLSSSSSSSSSTKQRLHHHHPTGRSGMGCCLYQDRTMLVYGGVRDTEKQNHQIDSIFFNDLFALHLDRKKWFPIHTRKNGTVLVVEEAQGVITTTDDVDDGNHNKNSSTSDTFTKDGSTVVEEELDDAEDSDDDHVQAHGGWDLDKLRSNMFAFIDGSGNLVYEKIDEDHDEDGELHNDETGRKMPPEDTRNQSNADDDEEKEETKEDDDSSSDQSAGDIVKTNASNPTSTLTMRSPSLRSKPKRSAPSKKGMVQDSAILPSITASSVMALDPITRMPVAVQRSEPLPRIKACTFVNGGLLYVYGGILEVGDREITLDDFWSFDLRRRDAWRCLFPEQCINRYGGVQSIMMMIVTSAAVLVDGVRRTRKRTTSLTTMRIALIQIMVTMTRRRSR